MEEPVVKKECLTCLYMATHEKCNEPVYGACLGSLEVRGTNYLYRNWVQSTVEDACERLRELERKGERSIVIGHEGEAEINVLSSSEATLESLVNVSCACGYLTRKLIWRDSLKIISFIGNGGEYHIRYDNDKFSSLDRITKSGKINQISATKMKAAITFEDRVRNCNSKKIYYADRQEALVALEGIKSMWPRDAGKLAIIDLHDSQVDDSGWCHCTKACKGYIKPAAIGRP